MTQSKLAALCGVSVATISKAFSYSQEISDETRKHIFDVAKQHGVFDKYNKNRFDKKVIAVVCPEFSSEYYTSMLAILENEISRLGGIMTVSCTNFLPGKEIELFGYYEGYCKADGIIFIGLQDAIRNTVNMPAVSVFPSESGLQSAGIEPIIGDTETSVLAALKHLKDLGHRDIGFVGENLTLSKAEHFKNALRKIGLAVKESNIRTSDYRFERAGKSVMDKWITEGDLPTAIVAAYDYIAIGILDSLTNASYRVPDDISVIGMDNISVTPYLDTPLSTVCSHAELACALAAELVFKKIANPYYHERAPLVVRSEFIERNSVRRNEK